MKRTLHRADWAYLFGIGALVVWLSFVLFRAKYFFLDFAITFEGGHRIQMGQVPYKDFFLPVGPVTFYVQALFNLIFGTNLVAMAVHGAVLPLILAITFYLVTRGRAPRPLRALLAVAMPFSLNIYHPWYNQEAFFFLTLNVLLLLPRLDASRMPLASFLSSALLTGLAYFSKQDIGVLHFLSLSLFFFLWGGSGWRKVTGCYVLPVLLGCALVPGIWTSYANFYHLFNLGFPPHLSRFSRLLTLPLQYFLQYQLYLAALFAFVLMKRGLPPDLRKRCYLALVLSVIPLVIFKTSGLPNQTLSQFVPVLLFFIYELVRRTWRWNGERFESLSFVVTALLIAITILRPLNLIGALRDTGQEGYTRIAEGSFKGCPLRDTSYSGLLEIRRILRANGGSFLNFSEYQFLYADLNVEPPRGFPLWFHPDITIFPADVPAFREKALALRPKIILFQRVHGEPEFYRSELAFFLAHRYQVIFRTIGPSHNRPIEVLQLQPDA